MTGATAISLGAHSMGGGVGTRWTKWLEFKSLHIISIIPYNFDFLNFFFTSLLVPPASIGQNVQCIKNLQFCTKWLEFKILHIILIIPYNFDFLNFFFTWLLVPPASIGKNMQCIKNLQFWTKWLEFKIFHIILIMPYNFDFLNFFAPSLWLALRLWVHHFVKSSASKPFFWFKSWKFQH